VEQRFKPCFTLVLKALRSPEIACAFSTPHRSAATAAANRVVREHGEIFQSSTPHDVDGRRRRHSVSGVDIQTRLGRSLGVMYRTGCSGALGSFIS